MTVTLDPAALANFFFVYPLQWWYYAVGVAVVATVRFIQSSLKKKVVPDASRASPLQSAQEYAEEESVPERDTTLEGLVPKPKIGLESNGSAIDNAMEYFLSQALINSAKYATFDGLKISTKFGEVTVSKPKEAAAPLEKIPQIPEEDQTEGNQ